MTPAEKADGRGRSNIALGRALFDEDDPRHPDMDFREAVGHRLLNAVGVPREQHVAFLAEQQERKQLAMAERKAVAQNMDAIGQFVGERMGLPDGLSFRYE